MSTHLHQYVAACRLEDDLRAAAAHRAAPREAAPSGGALRRLFKRPGDSPERVHEGRQAPTPDVSVAEIADRVLFGGFSQSHPGNRPRGRR
jgi:hypothetical protein